MSSMKKHVRLHLGAEGSMALLYAQDAVATCSWVLVAAVVLQNFAATHV